MFHSVQAFQCPLKFSTLEVLGWAKSCMCVRGISALSRSGFSSAPRFLGRLGMLCVPSDGGCVDLTRKCLLPRWRISYSPGHGAERQFGQLGPSVHPHRISLGLGDPVAAPAAGPGGPGAPGPGKAPHRGDSWQTYGIQAPAEAQALGGSRLVRGPRAAALDPVAPSTLEYGLGEVPEGAPLGRRNDCLPRWHLWVPEARDP